MNIRKRIRTESIRRSGRPISVNCFFSESLILSAFISPFRNSRQVTGFLTITGSCVPAGITRDFPSLLTAYLCSLLLPFEAAVFTTGLTGFMESRLFYCRKKRPEAEGNDFRTNRLVQCF